MKILIAGDHAFLVYVTRDGRQTVRPLASPEDVEPLAAALGVTVAMEGTAPPLDEAPRDRVRPAPAVVRSPASKAGFVLEGTIGGRVSSPAGFASPSLALGVGLQLGAWELLLRGTWDPAYAMLGARPLAPLPWPP